jgi:hypothetical protein
MKKLALLMSVVLSFPVFASYTYVITDGMDFFDLTLNSGQSLLMTGGWGGLLDLTWDSHATIQGTAPYNQDVYPRGGIRLLSATDYAHLDFYGGEVYELGLGAYATAVLSGGEIKRLRTGQSAWQYVGQPPVPVWNPHVEMIVKDWDYNTITKILTGIWGNDSLFNIQLVNIDGYSPTIDNIEFTIIPEPATLLLLAIGGILLKHR